MYVSDACGCACVVQPGGKDIAVTIHNLDEYLKVNQP